jgi:hypothetical protein
MPGHVKTRTLGDHMYGVLADLDDVTVYRGAVGLRIVDGREVQTPPPPIPGDAAGRVLPYAVLYTGAGRDTALTLGGLERGLDWTFQVTVAAGYPQHCEHAVDLIREALATPQHIDDLVLSAVDEDFDPGPMRLDQSVTPARHYLPLLFRLTATRGDTA